MKQKLQAVGGCALLLLIGVIAIGSGIRIERPQNSTRQEAPEFFPHFKQDTHLYVGEFFGNHAYLVKFSDGQFVESTDSDVLRVLVLAVRENFYFMFRNETGQQVAVIDPRETNIEDSMSSRDLKFVDDKPTSWVADMFDRAAFPKKYQNDQRQGNHATWVFVKDAYSEGVLNRYFVGPEIKKAPNGYDFVVLAQLEEELRDSTIWLKEQKSLSAVVDPVIHAPRGEPKERNITPGDVDAKIIELFQAGVLQGPRGAKGE